MRRVIISGNIWNKISEIKDYLIYELQFSETAAEIRINRMENFVATLSMPADYGLCRFKRWQIYGYRCAVFEKTWVFAYEVFDDGVIVRDMAHTAELYD